MDVRFQHFRYFCLLDELICLWLISFTLLDEEYRNIMFLELSRFLWFKWGKHHWRETCLCAWGSSNVDLWSCGPILGKTFQLKVGSRFSMYFSMKLGILGSWRSYIWVISYNTNPTKCEVISQWTFSIQFSSKFETKSIHLSNRKVRNLQQKNSKQACPFNFRPSTLQQMLHWSGTHLSPDLLTKNNQYHRGVFLL